MSDISKLNEATINKSFPGLDEFAEGPNLSGISTAALVKELATREGVEAIIAEPYEEYIITAGAYIHADTGPATILRVWD